MNVEEGKCPLCGNDLKYESSEIQDNQIFSNVSCTKCKFAGKEWHVLEFVCFTDKDNKEYKRKLKIHRIWLTDGTEYETDDLHYDVDGIWIQFTGRLVHRRIDVNTRNKKVEKSEEKRYIIPYAQVKEIEEC